MRANVVYRGLTHMLVAGLIQHSRQSLETWRASQKIASHDDFIAARRKVEAETVALSSRTRRMFASLRAFVDRRLHQGARLRGVAARARHVIAGLFRALTQDPRLADDYILIRFKEDNGGVYLRDLPAGEVDKEIARRYRGNPRFSRLVADHIAGMTDMFAMAEYERLLGPFPTGGGSPR